MDVHAPGCKSWTCVTLAGFSIQIHDSDNLLSIWNRNVILLHISKQSVSFVQVDWHPPRCQTTQMDNSTFINASISTIDLFSEVGNSGRIWNQQDPPFPFKTNIWWPTLQVTHGTDPHVDKEWTNILWLYQMYPNRCCLHSFLFVQFPPIKPRGFFSWFRWNLRFFCLAKSKHFQTTFPIQSLWFNLHHS